MQLVVINSAESNLPERALIEMQGDMEAIANNYIGDLHFAKDVCSLL